MKYDPDKHHRRSIRLKDYDYSQAGAYFVTICTNKESLFGEIEDGEMRLNQYGSIVHEEWLRTAELRNNIQMDAFVVMPNHMHGIIMITDDGRGVLQYAPTKSFRSPSQTIGAIVRGFKSTTTKRINELRGSFGTSVWQRNYYEHVIRDEDDLNRIREYIQNNPLNWDQDENNPRIILEAMDENQLKVTR
jgi:putative transposase